jgi:tetratricopeptide (TPR) repeat protein
VTLNSLSHVFSHQGRYDEAAASLEAALKIGRTALGNEHQLVGIYSINLGVVQLERKDFASAESLLREGLRIRALSPQLVPNRRRILPEDDWSLAAIKSLLGASLTGLGRYSEAEEALLEARLDLAARPASARRDIGATVDRLAALYQAWGKPDKAAAYTGVGR